jgi:epoxyqueuosine reductase
MNLTEQLHFLALDAGAAATGVCTTEPFADVALSMSERLGSGHSANLGFTYTAPEVATDVRQSFAWARSMFVVASAYLPDAGSAQPGPGVGAVARFATRDHYRDLQAILDAVALELGASGYLSVALRDDNRLVDRAAAVRAGVGWWGKNTMVLTTGAGPWILLGSVVTNAVLDVSAPMKRGCGTCERCLPACPTGALIAPGLLDARKCLAYWLQAPGVIPIELREAVGDRIYGCDDCLEACPPGSRLLAASDRDNGTVDLATLLSADDASLLADHAHFYIPGRRARYLRRNALVATGNTSGSAAVPQLAAYAGHPDWLLRAHAVWSLGQIGGSAATDVLAEAQRVERDHRVAAEVEMALSATRPGAGAGRLRSTLGTKMGQVATEQEQQR